WFSLIMEESNVCWPKAVKLGSWFGTLGIWNLLIELPPKTVRRRVGSMTVDTYPKPRSCRERSCSALRLGVGFSSPRMVRNQRPGKKFLVPPFFPAVLKVGVGGLTAAAIDAHAAGVVELRRLNVDDAGGSQSILGGQRSGDQGQAADKGR